MNYRILGPVLLASALTVGVAGEASAQFVDFENGASFGGDNASLPANAYTGFQFSLTDPTDNTLPNSGLATLESSFLGQSPPTSDANPQGFLNNATGNFDQGATPADAARLGNYFLRGSGLGQTTYPALLVTYDNLTSAASGEIWDIDGSAAEGYEAWKVELFDATKTLLDTIVTPIGSLTAPIPPGTVNLDGKPYFFSFTRSTNDVKYIRITYDAATVLAASLPVKSPALTGLAFDNFSAFSVETQNVPEPSALLGLGLLGLGGLASKVRSWRKSK